MRDSTGSPTVCLGCGFEIRGGFHQGEMCREIQRLRANDERVEDARAAERRAVQAAARAKANADRYRAEVTQLHATLGERNAVIARLSDRVVEHG